MRKIPKVSCEDLERILTDGNSVEWEGLDQHATTCAACAEEVRGWRALSAASQELRVTEQSPSLWPRIEAALIADAEKIRKRQARWGWISVFRLEPLQWQSAMAGACVLALTIAAGWMFFGAGRNADVAAKPLLKHGALADVERAESAYVQAIDKLGAEAKPQLDEPATPLLASYREKLLVLDGAIDELRAESGRNPSNAHLRYQLLAVFQEKQQTLQDVLELKNTEEKR